MTNKYDTLRAIRWDNDQLYLLDQRKLPHDYEEIELNTATDVAWAIKEMVVRGAPAIGITAAYGVVLAARRAYSENPNTWKVFIETELNALMHSRPTAVNLSWALRRMRSVFNHIEGDPEPLLLQEAHNIHQEDIDANYAMGAAGAALLPINCSVLTHCNTGSLATGGYGTALGVIRSGYADGRVVQVFADETRPWFQGARLTAWELMQDKIPVTLLPDSAAATLMRQKKVQWVIVGADRITANGDVANKIGTYSVAVLARQHGVKFMVVAPSSTVDIQLTHGDDIPIEERPAIEVLTAVGQQVAPDHATVWNPSFDVTPAELIDVIVTERGVVEQPNMEKMLSLMGGHAPAAVSA